MSTISRRRFLGTGVAIGAGTLLGATPKTAPPAGAVSTAPGTGGTPALTWEQVKAEFKLAPALAHMSGFFLASHPRQVREAIERHRAALDENPFHYLEDNWGKLEMAVREAAAGYVGCAPEDLALTDSTTMGLGLVYGGLRLEPGQEILTTTHDHIVTSMSLEFRSKRSGNPVRQVSLYDDPAQASVDGILERLTKALTPSTRIVAITWVHSGTGVKLPIRKIADAVAAANASRAPGDRALLCVDGVHGFGLEPDHVVDLGCDVFVASCHKWMLGPRGTGLVWARPEGWQATAPIITTFDPGWWTGPFEKLPAAMWMTPGGFHSFEHRWAVDEAFHFHQRLGQARVATRIHELNRRLREGLSRMPRVKLRTPLADELAAAIACFDVDGMKPAAVVAKLRERGIVASVTPGFYTPEYARLSAGLINLEADVDRALAEVRAL